jgi:hypothetical protein
MWEGRTVGQAGAASKSDFSEGIDQKVNRAATQKAARFQPNNTNTHDYDTRQSVGCKWGQAKFFILKDFLWFVETRESGCRHDQFSL